MLLEFKLSLWKLSVKELFPNKVIVSRPANNHESLQRNSNKIKKEIKFEISYLKSCEKKNGLVSNICAWTLPLDEVKAILNGLR